MSRIRMSSISDESSYTRMVVPGARQPNDTALGAESAFELPRLLAVEAHAAHRLPSRIRSWRRALSQTATSIHLVADLETLCSDCSASNHNTTTLDILKLASPTALPAVIA